MPLSIDRKSVTEVWAPNRNRSLRLRICRSSDLGDTAQAMSQENLDSQPPPEILALVMENFEWWNGGEPELMVDSYTEDGELDLSAVFTDTPVVQGPESMRRKLAEFWESETESNPRIQRDGLTGHRKLEPKRHPSWATREEEA
jgi:hypothetical protein